MLKRIVYYLILNSLLFTLSACTSQNDIRIVYTNDMHCGVGDNIGYAGLAAYINNLKKQHKYVTLVDAGDAVQGGILCSVSSGDYAIDIMNEIGFDFVTLGNHEFDYGLGALHLMLNHAKAEYLACNIRYFGKKENPLAGVKPFAFKQYGNKKVAFIGVVTPETITSTAPTYYMEDGRLVFDFSDDSPAELVSVIQKNVDEVRKAGADYVILLSHLGDDDTEFSSVMVANHTHGIDVILDGHAHSIIEKRIEKNSENQDVIISSTGRKLAHIGELTITSDGKISTKLISEYPEKDPKILKLIDTFYESLDENLKIKVGAVDFDMPIYDANGVRTVRNRETAMGDFCADAYRIVGQADIGVINGGGVRSGFKKGDITYADLMEIAPFGDELTVIEASGREIADLLEFSVRKTEKKYSDGSNAVGESGGFQSVSGLKFTVDTAVPSGVALSKHGIFKKIVGLRRVKDILVLNKQGKYVPLQPTKIYTLASNSFLLKKCGDGFDLFCKKKVINKEKIYDYEVLAKYLRDYLKGKIPVAYKHTAGLIIIK